MKATLLNLAFQMELLPPLTLCDAFLCLGVMPVQFSFFGMKTQRAASGKSADTSELVEPRSIIALLRCDALSRQLDMVLKDGKQNCLSTYWPFSLTFLMDSILKSQ